MKKVFLTLSLVAAAFFCQAQLFVGGDLGFSTKGGSLSGKEGNTSISIDRPKTTTFEIMPTIGFMFNENMGVGLDFGYRIENEKTTEEYDDAEIELKAGVNGWSVAPYFRYVFGQFDRVSLYADARINFGGGKQKYEEMEGNVKVSIDGDKVSNFGFNIVPGINFMISDNIALNAKLNLISLGYNRTKTTTKNYDYDDYDAYYRDDEPEYTIKDNSFGFGVNYRTALEVGFIYQF